MQQREQFFEEHDDGCVDEVNDMGFHPSSKSIEKESDSDFSNSPLPPKRSATHYIRALIFFQTY